MIPIVDLEFRFPHSDFRLAVSALDVADGERVAIVGPSGSGKTTLAASDRRHSGADARDDPRGEPDGGFARRGARRALRVTQIGLVFQSFELISYLDVFENILLPYRLNPALPFTPDVPTR